jgi:sugar/nucleoside kinase (ribokinase family)
MVDVMALLRGPLVPASDSPAMISMRGGGSAANTACWLASSGVETVYVGRVGDDLPGRVAEAELRRYGVHPALTVDPSRRTGTVIVLVDAAGERTMIPDAGANSGLTPGDLPADEFTAGRHLHLSGYTLLNPDSRAAGIAVLERARRNGMTTSVDPSSVGPLSAIGPDLFLKWVGGADLVIANLDEARVLTGLTDVVEVARKLAERFGEVVVKLGDRGALWQNSAGDAPVSVPAYATEIVDTTGAGDAFAAGFLPPWLAKASPEVALKAACRLAALAVSQVGGRP